MKPETKSKLLPLALTGAVLAADLIFKQLVLLGLAAGRSAAVFGDFFKLTIHRTPALIFRAGAAIPLLQIFVFFILPVLALGLLGFFYFREKGVKNRYRLPLAAILGGGLGILADRFFRPEGEVVFLDFKSFGIFGLSRWPAFNLAYLSILAGAVAILVIWIVHALRGRGISQVSRSAASSEPGRQEAGKGKRRTTDEGR